MSEHDPRERIAFSGELEPVFGRVASEYSLGNFIDYAVVPVGYEDFNVVLTTSSGRHFAKVFSTERTTNELTRFEGIMSAVLANGVSHPDIYKGGDNLIYHDQDSGLAMAVMQYVEGQTFYDVKRVPDDEELRRTIRQAVLVNQTSVRPPFLYDSWAVQHTREHYEAIKSKLPKADQGLIEGALSGFEQIDLDHLPHCFVHGDLVKSNVLKGVDGTIYILDFSVANWYPRIQELAVIIANLLNDEDAQKSYQHTIKQVTELYTGEGGSLSEAEIRALPTYARVAYAAELVGAHKERLASQVPPAENEYWLRLGRISLERSL